MCACTIEFRTENSKNLLAYIENVTIHCLKRNNKLIIGQKELKTTRLDWLTTQKKKRTIVYASACV